MRTTKLTMLALGGLATLGLAGTSAKSEPAAKSEAGKSRVRTIAGIRWHDNLSGAQRAARATRRTKARPVVLLRMLGDLAGKT